MLYRLIYLTASLDPFGFLLHCGVTLFSANACFLCVCVRNSVVHLYSIGCNMISYFCHSHRLCTVIHWQQLRVTGLVECDINSLYFRIARFCNLKTVLFSIGISRCKHWFDKECQFGSYTNVHECFSVAF